MTVNEEKNCRNARWIDILRFALAAALLLLTVFYVYRQLFGEQPEEELVPFAGQGTREDPYRIERAEDLALLAETVNGGETFDGVYFRQTGDLDLSMYENWTPIGVFDGNYAFAGVYDGDGHVIEHLVIHGEALASANVGLFGKLAGTVCNLGIESGEITGGCCGSITSHAAAGTPMIVNCYNKASISGGRCGGIADNFGGGKIICCWNTGALNGGTVGAITSYAAAIVYGCAGLQPLVNQNFTGYMLLSDVCTEIDERAVARSMKKARYEFDLQFIYG